MGRDARARALQLPAWNEALGLPRPWDQQWSLRIQQILAYETDLLEYPDIFEGSKVMEGLVDELVEGAREEMAIVAEQGGAVAAVPYMKTQMVESHRERIRRIESGELKVIGQNVYTEAEPSPLQDGEDGGILRVDPAVEASAIEALGAWRSSRDQAAAETAMRALRDAAADPEVNIMHATLDAARAGVTTGEWAAALRGVFGEYRAPTGVGEAAGAPSDDALRALRDRVEEVSTALGRRIKILVGKPGLDGHSNGAEQIAVRARDAGMDVVYEGIRLTPARIARTAVDEGVHVVGLSILSGSHAELIPTVLAELRTRAPATCPSWSAGSSRRRTRPRSWTPAWRASTRRRTSRSADHGRHRRLWSPSATAWWRSRSRGDPAELGRRLREGDRSAAAAALNLIENRADRDATQEPARTRSPPRRSAESRRRT